MFKLFMFGLIAFLFSGCAAVIGGAVGAVSSVYTHYERKGLEDRITCLETAVETGNDLSFCNEEAKQGE